MSDAAIVGVLGLVLVALTLFNNWLLHRSFRVLYREEGPNDATAIACISVVPVLGTIAALEAWSDARALKAQTQRSVRTLYT